MDSVYLRSGQTKVIHSHRTIYVDTVQEISCVKEQLVKKELSNFWIRGNDMSQNG